MAYAADRRAERGRSAQLTRAVAQNDAGPKPVRLGDQALRSIRPALRVSGPRLRA